MTRLFQQLGTMRYWLAPGMGVKRHVALAAASGAAPAGLDPYRRLAVDVLAPRLPLDRPRIDVPTFFRAEREIVLPQPA